MISVKPETIGCDCVHCTERFSAADKPVALFSSNRVAELVEPPIGTTAVTKISLDFFPELGSKCISSSLTHRVLVILKYMASVVSS